MKMQRSGYSQALSLMIGALIAAGVVVTVAPQVMDTIDDAAAAAERIEQDLAQREVDQLMSSGICDLRPWVCADATEANP